MAYMHVCIYVYFAICVCPVICCCFLHALWASQIIPLTFGGVRVPIAYSIPLEVVYSTKYSTQNCSTLAWAKSCLSIVSNGSGGWLGETSCVASKPRCCFAFLLARKMEMCFLHVRSDEMLTPGPPSSKIYLHVGECPEVWL